MTRSSLRVWEIWLLKGNLIIWAVNALLFVVLVLLGSTLDAVVSSAYFSKITLLETGITLLVAGAVAFSGSISSSKTMEYIRKTDEKWSMNKLRKSEKNANKYIVLAVLFFVESLIVSFLGA